MANQELVEYIKSQVAEGKGQDEIKALLLSHGWQEADVVQAFAVVSGVPLPPAATTVAPSTEPLPGAGQLLKEAWAIFSQRLNVFLGVMVVPALFVLVIAVLSISGAAVMDNEPKTPIAGLLIFLFIILYIIVTIWSQLAILHAAAGTEEQIGVKESYRRAYHGVMSYIWLSLLSGLVIMGGFMLFVVPGIIMAVSLSFATFVFVTEGLKGMSALLKSREYVKGKWGAIFWRQLFIGIICFLIIFIPQIPFMIIDNQVVGNIVNALSTMVAIPLAMVYSFLLFKKVKASKGEIVFTPTGGQKAKYWAIGILGPLVMGVFVLVMLVSLNSAREKSRDARRMADLVQIQSGLEFYYLENGAYPISLNELVPEYINLVPTDPETKSPYQYQKKGETGYEACVQLESGEERCASAE